MSLRETLPVKHGAHILICVSWAGSEGGLAGAAPQQVPGRLVFIPAGTWRGHSRDQAAGGEESQGRRGLPPGTAVGKRSFLVLYVSPWSSSVKGRKMVQMEILKPAEELAGASSGTWVLCRVCMWVGHGWLKQPGLSQSCSRHLMQVQSARSDL